MQDYLKGYLDVIPQGERQKVADILQLGGSSIYNLVSEEEFAKLIEQITEEHKQQTEFVQQGDSLSSALYNKFYSRLQVDMNVMYAETQLIEQALGSYDRLYDGMLADLSKEIKALKERIASLRLVAEGEDGLIVKTYDFRNNTDMETNREEFEYLFTDRDGSIVTDCQIKRNTDESYLTLSTRTSTDRIRDNAGKTVASLEVKDVRGTPVSKNTYPISNAIDDSPDSYWAEVVLVDEPINVALDDVKAGGAIVKFTITLPRPEIISEITLSPFTTYPIEIASIMYEEDTETYHIPQEILAKPVENTQTMTVQFPSIVAKRLTVVLRQKNYTKNSYLVREAELNKADLWDKIKNRETEITLDGGSTVSQSDLDTWSGWDIYQTELKKYEDAYAQFEKELAEYHRQWG